MPSSAFKSQRILIPTDFSMSAQMAVDTASDLAKEFQSAIYLLNVIPMLPIVDAPGYTTAIFPEQEYLEGARRSAEGSLLATSKLLQAEGITVDFSVEIGNDVVGNIMMVLDREHSDLVILSTHGVSGWRPMIFGSIAEKIIKLIECPLLLLRTPKTKAATTSKVGSDALTH